MHREINFNQQAEKKHCAFLILIFYIQLAEIIMCEVLKPHSYFSYGTAYITRSLAVNMMMLRAQKLGTSESSKILL